jgi:G3E family GTPase
LPDLRIDGIVLVLDAETVRQRAADPYVGDLVRQQLQDADLLILNKTELCSPTALAALQAWLPTMSSAGTPVVPTSQARVPPELVLGFQAGLCATVDGADSADPLARWAGQAIGSTGASAAERFVSELLKLPPTLDPQTLLGRLRDTSTGVVRAKGWLTDLSGQRHLLQQVGRRIELVPLAPEAGPPGPDRLLVIGLTGIYCGGNSLLNL